MTLELEPASGLTQEQQDIIGNNVAIDLTLRRGGTLISQFNGEAKVTVPFVLAGDKDAADVEVYYVAENGQLTKCASRYADGVVEFTTRHFSTYMVTYAGGDSGGDRTAHNRGNGTSHHGGHRAPHHREHQGPQRPCPDR